MVDRVLHKWGFLLTGSPDFLTQSGFLRTAGHFPAGPCAAAADLGAGHHLFVVTELLAGRGAGQAYVGANAARIAVKVRVAEHKVGARLADLGTVEQQTNVPRVGMLPAHL